MNVIVSTDGACSGNPGPGGWAAILRCGNNAKEISGGVPAATNSRMELQAVIEALAVLKKPCNVLIRTDSTMVCNAIDNLDSMPVAEYKTKTGAKRRNCDLLRRMYDLKHDGQHVLSCIHVDGHSGDPDNERCNTLARLAIAR